MKTFTPLQDFQINNDPILMQQALNLLNQQIKIEIKQFNLLKKQKELNDQQHRNMVKSNWMYHVDKKRIDREIRGIKKRYPNIETYITNSTFNSIEPLIEDKIDLPVQPENKSTIIVTNHNTFEIQLVKLKENYPLISSDKINVEKNYIDPPFKYIGSKRKLLPQILPEFDYSKKYFIELFCGAGSIYTNVIEKYQKIIINDLNPELMGIHKNLLYNTDSFLDTVKSIVPGKNDLQKYLDLRHSYNKNKTPEELFVLLQTCFSNILSYDNSNNFNQTFRYRNWNNKIGERINEFVEHVYPYKDKITFLNKRFEDVIVPNNSMVYLDPPYIQSKIKYYGGTWRKEDDNIIYDYIKRINENGNSFILSGTLSHDGKESELLKKLIEVDGFTCKHIKCDYSNVSQSKRNKKTVEVIVKNF